MNDNSPCYILIHSPLVGPSTWQLVAKELQAHGHDVFVPTLTDDPQSSLPFCQQHAAALAQDLAHLPPDCPLILVAHSGAGPILPLLRSALPQPIAAYIFVDAGIPRHNASRLDLIRLQEQPWVDQFHQKLLDGGRFPTWQTTDLQEIIPDESLRQKTVEEINPRSLPFFAEPIPVFPNWPDAPCIYIKFSAGYTWDFQHALKAQWAVDEVDAGHFHMLVDPQMVAALLVKHGCIESESR